MYLRSYTCFIVRWLNLPYPVRRHSGFYLNVQYRFSKVNIISKSSDTIINIVLLLHCSTVCFKIPWSQRDSGRNFPAHIENISIFCTFINRNIIFNSVFNTWTICLPVTICLHVLKSDKVINMSVIVFAYRILNFLGILSY